MTCANFEIALCDYLDGTLAPAEKAEVEQHMSTCASCAELARDAGAAIAFIERVADVEPPPELVTRMFAIPGMPEARASIRRGIRSWFRNLMQPMLQCGKRAPDGLMNAERVRILHERGKQELEPVVMAAAGNQVARERKPRAPVLRVVVDDPPA